MREQAYKIEIYYRERPVFKLAYFPDLESAERAAREGLNLDEDVREVRLLDESGRILRTFDKT